MNLKILPDEDPMTAISGISESFDLQFQPPDRTPDQLEDLRILVVGLGRHGGGIDLVRFLCSRGAKVSISDQSSRETLEDSLQKISDLDLQTISLDGHREEDLVECDWAVVNPAIPPNSPFLQQINSSGVRPVTEMGLTLSWLPPDNLAAITGTNGKSTTCVLATQMIQETGLPVRAGGNLGGSLLPCLDQPDQERRYVVEVSSFQAQRLETAGARPKIVSITNLSPDHLDWHGNEEQYRAAKSRLLEACQLENALAILPTTGFFGRGFDCSHRKIIRCGTDGDSLLKGGVLHIEGPNGEMSIPYHPTLALEGDVGTENALHAATIAAHMGASANAIDQAIQTFQGLPHRYQELGELNGIRFIDDSKATSPDSAAAALRKTSGSIHWLCGGKSKGTDLSTMVAAASEMSLHAYCFGAVQEELQQALKMGKISEDRIHRHENLELAFEAASNRARAGEVVLLSPGFASFDQYSSFEERGEHFQRLVKNPLSRSQER